VSLLMEALRKAERLKEGEDGKAEASAEEAVVLEPLDEDSVLTLDMEEEESEMAAEGSATPPNESFLPEEPVAQPTPKREQMVVESPHPLAEGDSGEMDGSPVETERPQTRAKAEPEPPVEPELAVESEPAVAGQSGPAGDFSRLLLETQRRRRRLGRLAVGMLLLGFVSVVALATWYYNRLQPEAVAFAEAGEATASSVVEEEAAAAGNATRGAAVRLAGAGVIGAMSARANEAGAAENDSAAPLKRNNERTHSPAEPSSKSGTAGDERGHAGEKTAAEAASVRDSKPRTPAAEAPNSAKEAYRKAVDERSERERKTDARIEIRRGRAKSRGRGTLQRAWNAFHRGHYQEAKRLYRSVLKKDPHNRDALLGLAAGAVASGNEEQAQRYYLDLLERNPRDPAALAGMIALRGSGEAAQAASRIRDLIAENPQLGGLHFILGNLYADQSRWGYAQQAYFRAHVLDPQNPDYIFNLAVSLDHLGKRKQALDYYRQAVAAAAGRRVGFSLAAARQRIAALDKE